jgi:hypothetical protein
MDRSASMGDPGGKPIRVAKDELLRSLDSLGDVQQFQIIFYNQQPHLSITKLPVDSEDRLKPILYRCHEMSFRIEAMSAIFQKKFRFGGDNPDDDAYNPDGSPQCGLDRGSRSAFCRDPRGAEDRD